MVTLWQDARSALQHASVRVSLIGYSLPVTDLVTSGMLKETILQRMDADNLALEVVNPNPKLPLDHLAALGVDGSNVSMFESVEAFTDEYQRAVSSQLTAVLNGWQSDNVDSLMLVGSSVDESRKVVAIRRDGRVIHLVLESGEPPYVGLNIPHPGHPQPLALRELLAVIADGDVERIDALGGSGGVQPVVGAAELDTNTGAPGSSGWQVFVTPEPVS